MARLDPFRGVRYDAGAVRGLDRVISPPYDVIDEDQVAALCARSAHNIARIIRADPAGGYGSAAADLKKWRDEGALRRDREPAIYVYEQRFHVAGAERRRTAMIGLVAFDGERSRILPHERTLSGPRADRLELLRATRMTFGQIFALYQDPDSVADELCDRAKAAAPLDEPVEEDGVEHRLWAVTDREVIGRIQRSLAGRDLLIADGHHRFETARDFFRENPSMPGAGRRMMALVNMRSPGLAILPIHRVVKNVEGFSARGLLDSLAESFDIRVFDGAGPASRRAMVNAMRRARKDGRNGFGLFVNDGAYRALALRRADALQGLPAARRRLDVAVLHSAILDRRLGIDAAALEAGSRLEYVVDIDGDPAEAAQMVADGRGQAAFFLNPVSADEVEAAARAGERMPQKTTFFHPKVYTGFVMHDLASD